MSGLIPSMPGVMPLCAVCKKPVQEVKSWFNRMTSMIEFEFSCHGEKEHAVISQKETLDCRITLGECFTASAARKSLGTVPLTLPTDAVNI